MTARLIDGKAVAAALRAEVRLYSRHGAAEGCGGSRRSRTAHALRAGFAARSCPSRKPARGTRSSCADCKGRPHAPMTALVWEEAAIRGHSVESTLNNAKEERDGNIYAARLWAEMLSALRLVACAARSHRKSPEKAMCSHPTGDVWAISSSGTAVPADRRWATASAM